MTLFKLLSQVSLLSLLCFTLPTFAAQEVVPKHIQQQLKAALTEVGFRSDLKLTAQLQDGLYLFQSGVYRFQISEKGDFRMHGEVWHDNPLLESLQDPKAYQQWRREVIKQSIDALDETTMQIYPASLPSDSTQKPYQLTIFTDVSCPYSRQLHAELDLLQGAGVRIRYLAFPRLGMESIGAKQMQAVWCHPQPREGLDNAMNQQRFAIKRCQDPIEQHLALGMSLGVIGTPSLFFEDGRVSTGYSSAVDLLNYIENQIPLPETTFSESAHIPAADQRPLMPPSDAVINALQNNLNEVYLQQLDMDDIHVLPDYSGMYAATVGSFQFYISTDGDIVLRSPQFEQTDQILSVQTIHTIRQQSLKLLSNDSVIWFSSSAKKPPENPSEADMIWFIDDDCLACSMQYQLLPELQEMGLNIAIMAAPQQGLDSEQTKNLARIWCAQKPQQALLDSRYQTLDNADISRCDAIIAAHHVLSASLGVIQTPSIILKNGALLTGYQSYDQLIVAGGSSH